MYTLKMFGIVLLGVTIFKAVGALVREALHAAGF